jgi:hypothetical protein
MTNTMNKKENGIIAVKMMEAGYLRSQSNPFIWAIKNACFIANAKEDKVSTLLSVCTIYHGKQASNNAKVIENLILKSHRD